MKIVIVGYGFYVLGNENLEGGTVLPSLLRWAKLHRNKLYLTILVSSENSRSKAKERFSNFIKKNDCSNLLSFNINTYHEFDSSKIQDCAIIAIPETSHLKTIEFLSKVTKEILCVKPFTQNLNQVKEANKIADQNNVNIFIDFHKRFDEANIEFIKNATNKAYSKGLFTFSYGQKAEMPLNYFKKWSFLSNPFQYLAPHYLHIIFSILEKYEIDLSSIKVDGNVNFLNFPNKAKLISILSCNLKLYNNENYFLVNSICNWMEPKSSPFNSRQRIEFLTDSLHLISEQDNRGQMIINDETVKIPNPHFMTNDEQLFTSGYGINSFCNFLDYIVKRFPKEALISSTKYEPIAKVIDYVNNSIKEKK